ncbi:DUF2142 domain-containing protein [Microbacterium immunditiarum]|uniref:DUF2142 domain-containing protein n=1 Tax=Microbacterium immunditiarum TaxID=337480 RepID=A0A7Y9KIX7_9MICO|nr:DUF2142 domain-containing protein [Microbacterium immunditiarum]NYE21037.1 hypothetical protein [Microbacterium immunditiarum]
MTTPTTPSNRRSARSLIRTFWIPFVLLFLASTAWTFATPLAAAPDEPAHILKAAGTARGQFLPDGFDEAGRGYFTVPASLSDAREWEDCFAHKAAAPASCQVIDGATPGTERASTTAAAYNPLYYGAVGWASLLTDDPHAIVYGMRLATALGTAALIALAFHFLSAMMGLRRASVVLAATATPMLLFLGGVVNPNAWEIAGGMALLAAVLALAHRRDGVPSPNGALATIAAVGFIVCNLRGISPLWVAVLGLLGLSTIPWPTLRVLFRSPATWVAAAALLAGATTALLWGAAANYYALEGDFRNKDWTAGRVLEMMFRRTIFEPAYVGLFGWTDTSSPTIAIVILGGLGVLTVVAAFWLARRRFLIVTLVAGAAWLLLPALVQLSYVRSAGMIWQGRYSMVMYVGMVILAAVAANIGWGDRPIPHPRRLAWSLGAFVWAAHVYTFVLTQVRYARGAGETIWMLFKEPLWSPPLGASVWLLLIAVAVSGFVVLAARQPTSTAAPETIEPMRASEER